MVLGICLGLLLTGLGAPQGKPTADVLAKYAGKSIDLSGAADRFDEKQWQARKEIMAFVNLHPPKERRNFIPYDFSPIAVGVRRLGADWQYVVVVAWNPMMVPGESSCEVHLFAPNGKPISSVFFCCANRLRVDSIRFKNDPDLGYVIDLYVGPNINGPRLSHIYYGFAGNRPALLRAQGWDDYRNKGADHLVRTGFQYPNYSLGPIPPARTPAQVIQVLDGADSSARIECLNWLAGEHAPLSLEYNRVFHEPVGQSVLFWETAGNQKVRAAVERAANSSVPWVRETANLALQHLPRPFQTSPPAGGDSLARNVRIVDTVVGRRGEFADTDRPLKVGDEAVFMLDLRSAEGKTILSTFAKGQRPLEFEVGHGYLVDGVDRGLVGMKIGGERTILIPSNLGYGNNQVDWLPPGSDLEAKLKLLDFIPAGDYSPHWRDVRIGKGNRARKGNRILCHFVAYRADGKILFSTRKSGKPRSFSISSSATLYDMETSLVGMRIGGIRRVHLRPLWAYVRNLDFDENSVGVAEIEFLKILPKQEGG